MTVVRRAVAILSSLRLGFVLLLFLGLLTWLGTLEQAEHGLYAVQKKYFESFFLVHRAGPVPIPLPGANLVLWILFANLVTGGIVRLRRTRSRAGILLTHVGVALLLVAGFTKMYFSEEGHVTLFEGQRAEHFQSYHRWEIAVTRALGDGKLQEYRAPHEDLARGVTLRAADLPFDLRIDRYHENCRPERRGERLGLRAEPRLARNEANAAGAVVTLVDKREGTRREGVLWGRDRAPWTVRYGGEDWAIDLRRERYPLGFALELDEFTKEDHPGTGMPRWFSSDVRVHDDAGARPVRISMNEPLRDRGLVLYQASWGPQDAPPGAPLFSTLAVVRNPADQWPLVACVVIALGLLLHFGRGLLRFLRTAAPLLLLAATARADWSERTVELAEELPVQDGGRVKPLGTYARVFLLRLSGRRGPDATALLLDAVFRPEEASGRRVFLVQDSGVLEQLGLDLDDDRKRRDRWSYEELRPGLPRLFQLAHEYAGIDEKQRTSVQEQTVHLAGNVLAFHRFVDGKLPLALIPPAQGEEWLTPAEAGGEWIDRFEALARARDDPAAFESEMTAMHAELVARAKERGEYDTIPLELFYYRSGLLHWSLGLFVLAFLAVAVLWLRPRGRWLHRAAFGLAAGGTVVLAAVIALRCVIRGRPPVSTLYETVLFITAVGAAVALFLEAVNRRRIALSAAAVLGTVGLFLANGYESLDRQDTMPSLVAVLDTNFWLATHVTAITIGYAAGLLAALLASFYLVAHAVRRTGRDFRRNVARMVWGTTCFALLFSLVGTILGGIWANESWGRFWGWDPKENGALLICLSQIALIHGRRAGLFGDHGVCMAAAFGGSVIAFSWWGVNLLGVGLHSYGFTSGVHSALWTYYGIQWSVVGLGAWAAWRDRRRPPPLPRRSAEGAQAAGESRHSRLSEVGAP